MPIVLAVALVAVFVNAQTAGAASPEPVADVGHDAPASAGRVMYACAASVTLDEGTLFVRDGLKPSARLPLMVHFHGAPGSSNTTFRSESRR